MCIEPLFHMDRVVVSSRIKKSGYGFGLLQMDVARTELVQAGAIIEVAAANFQGLFKPLRQRAYPSRHGQGGLNGARPQVEHSWLW